MIAGPKNGATPPRVADAEDWVSLDSPQMRWPAPWGGGTPRKMRMAVWGQSGQAVTG